LVVLSGKDLRSGVALRAIVLVQDLLGPDDLGKSEVYKLRSGLIGAVCHHNILQLDVSVHDPVVMHKLKAN
jgi:hypothetical protein